MASDIVMTADDVRVAARSSVNVIEILESALPSSVLAAIESSLKGAAAATTADALTFTHPLSASSVPAPTASSAQAPERTTPPATSATPTASSVQTHEPTTPAVTSAIPTASTAPLAAVSVTTSAIEATISNPAAPSSNHLPNNAVAGVATGAIAGAVLIILALVYCLRRRQQQMWLFGRRSGSDAEKSEISRPIYPEVAWLYDPSRASGAPELSRNLSRTFLPSTAADDDRRATARLLPPSPPNNNPYQYPAMPELGDNHHATDNIENMVPMEVSSPLLEPALIVPRNRYSGVAPPHRGITPPRASLTHPALQARHDSWTSNKEAWTSSPDFSSAENSRSSSAASRSRSRSLSPSPSPPHRSPYRDTRMARPPSFTIAQALTTDDVFSPALTTSTHHTLSSHPSLHPSPLNLHPHEPLPSPPDNPPRRQPPLDAIYEEGVRI